MDLERGCPQQLVQQLREQLARATAGLRGGSFALPSVAPGTAGVFDLPPLAPQDVASTCGSLMNHLAPWHQELERLVLSAKRGGPLLPGQEVLVTSLAAQSEELLERLLPDTLRLAACRLGELLERGLVQDSSGLDPPALSVSSSAGALADAAAAAPALGALRVILRLVALISWISSADGLVQVQSSWQQQLQQRHPQARLAQLHLSVSSAEVLDACASAARHIGTAMRLLSQPGGGPWPAEAVHWEQAVLAGVEVAWWLSNALYGLTTSTETLAKAARAAARAGLPDLAGAVCGMLLAPERVQPLAMFSGDLGSLAHWMDAAFEVFCAATFLCTYERLLPGDRETALAVQDVLASPAMQRLLLASAAAFLMHVPPLAPVLPGQQQRRQELVALLPGPVYAAAVVLAAGVEPLPRGLQPTPAVALRSGLGSADWVPLTAALAAALALSLPTLAGSGGQPEQTQPQAAANILTLVDLHLAAAALGLRVPAVAPWLLQDPPARALAAAQATVRACSAAAGSDPRVCGTAYGRLLHAQQAVALAMALWDEGQQAQPQAQVRG